MAILKEFDEEETTEEIEEKEKEIETETKISDDFQTEARRVTRDALASANRRVSAQE